MGCHASSCSALQRDARAMFREALERCSVEHALAAKLRSGSADAVSLDAVTIRLEGVRRLVVVAMGKGAVTMLRALLRREDIVGGRQITGVLAAPAPPSALPEGILFFLGAHPLPDAGSRRAAEAVLRCLREEPASDGTLCLFLISGGASAMVELPLDERIRVEDTASFYRALVHGGLPITAMNTLRKHFSAVKGGRLAQVAEHLRHVTLLVSDVPPDHLDALASGPTLPDRTTVADCHRILRQYGLLPQFPDSVRTFFTSGALPETPKPGELKENALLLLSQSDLARAAADIARERGYCAIIDDTPDDWPAADAAQYLLDRFRALRQEHGRVCLVSTGEVAVRVPESVRPPARGGRNQHFVLECAARFREDDDFAVLSCGSDGVDGNSSAAGAVIHAEDFHEDDMQRRVREALHAFDSGSLLRRMGCAVETGPTGTNLRDLRMLLG